MEQCIVASKARPTLRNSTSVETHRHSQQHRERQKHRFIPFLRRFTNSDSDDGEQQLEGSLASSHCPPALFVQAPPPDLLCHLPFLFPMANTSQGLGLLARDVLVLPYRSPLRDRMTVIHDFRPLPAHKSLLPIDCGQSGICVPAF